MEKIALPSLCLHHFLAVAEAIVEQAEALRELNARAQGERRHALHDMLRTSLCA